MSEIGSATREGTEASVDVTAGMPPNRGNFLGHPRMLWMLLAVTVGFNYAFYAFRAFLAPYVADAFFADLPHDQALQQANLLFAGFGTLLYATPIVGGWVADNVLGKVRSLRISLWLGVIGILAMASPSKFGFLLGLAFFVVTAGLNIPLTVLIGLNYAKNDPKRDAGYTLFYLGINLGAFIAPFIAADWIGSRYGFRWGFVAAAVGMFIVALIFEWGHRRLPGADEKAPLYRGYSTPLVVLCCLILTYPCALLLSNSDIVSYIVYALMAALVGYFIVSSWRRGDRVQTERYIAILILFIALVVFWAWSLLSASALNFFARDYVNAPWNFTLFQSANPLYILILAIPISLLWPWLDKRRINPSTPRKFGIGIVLVALGYGVLVLADRYGVGADDRIAWWPLALCYLFSTVGELALSPIGYAMIGKLAAPEETSLAMGGWFFGVSVSYDITGKVAALTTNGTYPGIAGYTHVFEWLLWVGLAIGIVYLLVSPLISRLMHGVH